MRICLRCQYKSVAAPDPCISDQPAGSHKSLTAQLARRRQMATYKLTYFPCRGRAELIRLIFAQAEVEYENVRLPYYPFGSAEWDAFKKTLPSASQTLPILEVEGRTLSGHMCIARYLAEKFGLAGKTSLENCELEGIVDAIADGWTAVILATFYQKNNELKEEKCKEVYEKTLPNLFTQVNGMIEKNGRPEGWVWGDELTYADLAIYHLFSHVVDHDATALAAFPHLALLHHSVENLPNIAKWLQERPEDLI